MILMINYHTVYAIAQVAILLYLHYKFPTINLLVTWRYIVCACLYLEKIGHCEMMTNCAYFYADLLLLYLV